MIWIEIFGECYVDEEVLEYLEINKDPDEVTEEEVVAALNAMKIKRREILNDIIMDYDINIGSTLYRD